MQSPEDSLIHEASALYRLVESIDRFVAEQQNSYTYTDSTEAFFHHIRESATATKAGVSHIVAESAQKPRDIAVRYRPDLIIQKDHCRILHTYVKPASEAHTLSLPVPLLHLAGSHLRLVKGMEDVDLVALLTPELMYFENHPRAGVPGNFIFVELPYSQGPAFFTNLTIYHEIAHFVFEKLEADATEGSVVAELAQAMEAAFEANLGKQLPSAPNRTWAKEVLRAWTREVFCDLFACRFLGPAFMFALIDVLSLIGLMDEGTTAAIEFEKEHPAPALRLQEQVNQLRRDDWWQTVQDLPTDHVALSRRLAPRDDSHYEFIFNDTKLPGFIETFLKIVPYIHPVVESITPPSRTAAADFGKSASDIEKCFLHGVVPSHLSQQGSAKGPSQVSIVNAAYCFYLTSMPKLMDKIGEDPGKLDKRSELTAKLERVGRLKPLRTVSYTPLCGRDIELSVFSNAEISDRLSRKVEDPEGLVVTPLLDKEDALDADSIDLRLGTHFLLPRSLPEPYFAPDRNTATSLHLRVHVPLGRYLVVPAHQTVLGATLEFISCNATPPERFLLSPPWLARSSSSRQRRGFTRSTGAAYNARNRKRVEHTGASLSGKADRSTRAASRKPQA